MSRRLALLPVLMIWLNGSSVRAQAPAVGGLGGRVTDETGGVLPGVWVELKGASGSRLLTVTDPQGVYRFDGVASGRYQVAFTLPNFATTRRDINVAASGASPVDAVLHLALNAEVTVTGKRTFANLADVENPTENLVGIAQSASQGAITAAQLDARPIMRAGEVLETVPGVIISQHSGEGKANQYYLRGFNLDHGTDFATTIASMPVNMPSHAHGQGYSDLNFLIPELVTGVQYQKGPYYAEQGDFSAAGAANISYANALDRSLARVSGGQEGWSRALFASSPQVGHGHVLLALEANHNNGAWVHPDDYKRLNGVIRYSQGDGLNGFAVTAMGYHATWNSTDQVAQRAIDSGLIPRYGAIDPTDGGNTYRYSGSFEWQRSRGQTVTTTSAFGIRYQLNLFSLISWTIQ